MNRQKQMDTCSLGVPASSAQLYCSVVLNNSKSNPNPDLSLPIWSSSRVCYR